MSKKAPILQLIVGEDAVEGDEEKSYLAVTPTTSQSHLTAVTD